MRNNKNRDGDSLVNIFKYQPPFGLHFCYHHQIYDQKNCPHSPISLDRTQATKFWTNLNSACYLAVIEVNIELASEHFQNGGNIVPTLSFRRQLAINCIEYITGTEPGDIGRPMWDFIRPKIVEYNVEKVPNYLRKWLASEKN